MATAGEENGEFGAIVGPATRAAAIPATDPQRCHKYYSKVLKYKY